MISESSTTTSQLPPFPPFEVVQDGDTLTITESYRQYHNNTLYFMVAGVFIIGLVLIVEGIVFAILAALVYALVLKFKTFRLTEIKVNARNYVFDKKQQTLQVNNNIFQWNEIKYIQAIRLSSAYNPNDYDSVDGPLDAQIKMNSGFVISLDCETGTQQIDLANMVSKFVGIPVTESYGNNYRDEVAEYRVLCEKYKEYTTDKLEKIVTERWLINDNQYKAAKHILYLKKN